MHNSTLKLIVSSLSAWLVKRHAGEPLLQVVVLDADLNGAIALVLKELIDRLVNLVPQHLLRIALLFVICLTIVVHITTNDVVSD